MHDGNGGLETLFIETQIDLHNMRRECGGYNGIQERVCFLDVTPLFSFFPFLLYCVRCSNREGGVVLPCGRAGFLALYESKGPTWYLVWVMRKPHLVGCPNGASPWAGILPMMPVNSLHETPPSVATK